MPPVLHPRSGGIAAVGPRLMVRYGQVEEGQPRFMSLAEVARGASQTH